MTFENKIRNITGTYHRGSSTEGTFPNNWSYSSGAFFGKGESGDQKSMANSTGRYNFFTQLGLDVSRVVSTAPENRPNSIYALPIIPY